MFKKSIIAIALTATGFMLSAGAAAQTYVGASVGDAKWNMDCSGASSCSTSDTAYKVYGGYNFAPQWAVEATYFSLGTINASGAGYNVSAKGTGFDVSGVFKAQLNKDWTAFAKLGVAQVKGETTASVGSVGGSLTKNSTQPIVGFGVIYNVNQNFGIRADIDSRKVELTSGSGGSGNVTNFTIGAQASF